MPKTWLITGASSGIGYGIALAALENKHQVIATARNPNVAAANHPEFTQRGGRWERLDVSVPEAQQAVEQIIKDEEERERDANGEGGKIHWVIVNNAGVMDDGLVEDQRSVAVSMTRSLADDLRWVYSTTVMRLILSLLVRHR